MYKGYREICPSSDELAVFYESPEINRYGCLINEYLVVKDTDGNVLDKLKWTGDAYKAISYRQISNDYIGVIKPRNLQQEFAFDMLQDKKTTIKMLLGPFGSGKSMGMIATALYLIKKGQFDKIVYVRNNIETKDSKPLGALPGGSDDKLLPFALPVADHVGGVDGLKFLQSQGKIEITHLGFLRGRDIRNAILLVGEAGNLTTEHMQLLIGRIGEGSSLWIDGDLKQVDMDVFEKNSGIKRIIERLQGNPLFGYVHLEKSERSPTAALADLLD